MQRTLVVSILVPFLSAIFLLSSLAAQDAAIVNLSDSLEVGDAEAVVAAGFPADAELTKRLSQLNGCIAPRMHPVVKGYIRTYTQIKLEKTRLMLGRRLTYFPLFEEQLQEGGLPADLKYLSVVESALDPKAVSRVGATGLWQFMPATGAEYGLKVDKTIDERSDPVQSTQAAVQYLKNLFRQYNDWALALAAYNSGPGRVNAAIKRAHSRNFWQLQRYLPTETRNYVPAFIAATYICNYFMAHQIDPVDPDFDMQLTRYIRVFESLTFRDISDATGLPLETIRTLNPGYKRDFVPNTSEGHFVVLPERVMPAFVRYLNTLSGRPYVVDGAISPSAGGLGDGKYWKTTFTVPQADQIERVAALVNVHPEHLKAWNKLAGNYLYAGQVLQVYRPVLVKNHQNIRIDPPMQEGAKREKTDNSTLNGAPGSSKPVATRQEPIAQPKQDSYLWHTVARNESLDDIARRYGVSVDALRKLNEPSQVSIGMRLKIKILG